MKNTVMAVLAATVLFSCALFGQAAGEGPLAPAERELADLINGARAAVGLPAIPLSVSLTKVARLHVVDLNAYRPDTGSDPRGQACNLHSWSANGNWTPVCYTDDHLYSYLMWNKPSEITTAYGDNGYEIAYVGGADATPAAALSSWKGSPAHLDVILERGIWANSLWQSLGVGISGKYAAVWFGEDPDPAGVVPAAAATAATATPMTGPVVSTDKPDVVGPYGGLALKLKKEKFGPGESVEFTVSKPTPGTADLTNSHYRVDIKTDRGWEVYYRSGHLKYKQGLILESGKAKGYGWNRKHLSGTHEAKPGKTYRIKFYAPKTTKDVLHARFKLVE
jgi:hypothetical protein